MAAKRKAVSPNFGITFCWSMDYEKDDMIRYVEHHFSSDKLLKMDLKNRKALKFDDYTDQTHLLLFNVPFRHANSLKMLEELYASLKWLKEFPTLGPKIRGKTYHSIERIIVIIPSCSKPKQQQPSLSKQLSAQNSPIQKGLPPPPISVFWDADAITEMSQDDEEWYNNWIIEKEKKIRRPNMSVTAEHTMMQWMKYLNVDTIWLSEACENRAAHHPMHRSEHFKIASILHKDTIHNENEKISKASLVKDFMYIAEGCIAPDIF